MTTNTYTCEWCKTHGSKDPNMLCQFTTTAYHYDGIIEKMKCTFGDRQEADWKLTNSLDTNEELKCCQNTITVF